ncbi:MAG TPA: hypothetical protein ENG74_01560 [Thermoplasmatales archaeon]|nr:hypothetical protein [Thermoplasmatales archaeon]
MRLEIRWRDGAARCGFFNLNGKGFGFPNILFISTSSFKPPEFASIVGFIENRPEGKFVTVKYPSSVWNEKNLFCSGDLNIPKTLIYPSSLPSEFHEGNDDSDWVILSGNEDTFFAPKTKGKIFSLANAASLFPKSELFIENMVRVRECIGYSSLLHVPAIATPSNLSLLAYLGIDMVDCLVAISSARQGYLLFPEGEYHKDELDEKICFCPACSRYERAGDMGFSDILEHNYTMLFRELNLVVNAIRRGRLRELVEKRIMNSTDLAEKFRILNEKHYEFIEERTPILKRSKLLAISRDSLSYPEIVRFRYRVINRYRKPDCARILVLLPCSARKPYYLSKSHKLFRKIILSCNNPWVVHEVIVTSPLGLVPRELELIYPASNYDIPVTGHWYDEEMSMIKEMLASFLQINTYDAVISHLPLELDSLVRDVHNDTLSTCKEKPTSRESLENLRNALKELITDYEFVPSDVRYRKLIKCIAEYQFGRRIAERIIEGHTAIKGKYPNLKLIKDGKQVVALSGERGLLSLTLEGGKILAEMNVNYIRTKEDVKLKGSLLAAGITDADPNIRIEDEVVIIKDENVFAVGTAKMNGKEMMELSYGEAVRIRHHV